MKTWDYLVVILLVAILAVQIYSLVRKRENMSPSPAQIAQSNARLQQAARAFGANNQPTWQPNAFGGFSYEYNNPKQNISF